MLENWYKEFDFKSITLFLNTMFIANAGDNKVYVASVPSGISQKPKGITHDGTNFYILVNGNKTDHIIVTDAS